jgi:hypothetical protein
MNTRILTTKGVKNIVASMLMIEYDKFKKQDPKPDKREVGSSSLPKPTIIPPSFAGFLNCWQRLLCCSYAPLELNLNNKNSKQSLSLAGLQGRLS